MVAVVEGAVVEGSMVAVVDGAVGEGSVVAVVEGSVAPVVDGSVVPVVEVPVVPVIERSVGAAQLTSTPESTGTVAGSTTDVDSGSSEASLESSGI